MQNLEKKGEKEREKGGALDQKQEGQEGMLGIGKKAVRRLKEIDLLFSELLFS